MYATVRRDEGINRVSSDEVTSKVGDGLLPALRKLPGFSGCYVFDAGEGVFTPDRPVEDSSAAMSRWHRRELGARAEARVRTSERAEDHRSTGRRALADAAITYGVRELA
jgi:hypothetical protein